MKQSITILLCLVCSVTLFAQEKMYIHKSDKLTLGALINKTDSVYFSNDGSKIYFRIGETLAQYAVSEIDSISFGVNSSTISVIYNGTSASVINPLAFEGVSVNVKGADVIVTSTLTDKEINYSLKGTTSDGMFKIYSNYKFNLVMDGVSLTNSDGPAINIQSSKKGNIILNAGTTNSLTDGSTYAKSTEDQKSTLFSEGQLEVEGTGSLTVKSNSKHAICSDDYINIKSGTITVSGASKDGIHAKEYFKMSDGTLNITATSDGIESEGYAMISGGNITTINASADVKGITCDSTMVISGGTINMTVSGNQSKGIKAAQNMTLNGGTITINTSGAAVLSALGSGYDPSYCTAIKCDSTINIGGANITITSTGVAGKGISSGKNINVASGTINISTTGNGATYLNSTGVTDSYTSSGIDADGNISIIGGSVTVIASGTGCKGISGNGDLTFGDSSNSPTVITTVTGTRLLVSGTSGYATANYAKPKCIKSDGILTVNNGTFTLSTSNSGSSCFDSNSSLLITGGSIGLTVGGNQSKGIAATKAITLSGGTITINATGGVELETSGSGYDPAYCKGINSDADINICGSNITITSSGTAGKGVSSDTNINMTSGVLKITSSGTGTTYKNTSGTTDSYSVACLSSANINIIGGTVTTSSSGAGGKGFKADTSIKIGDSNNSPTIGITTSGAKFLVSSSGSGMNASTDYCHPKAIVCDGSVTINNGNTTISSSDDGIHAEQTYTQNSGSVTINNSYEGVESFNITLIGGTLNVTASNDGMNATAGLVSGGTESNDGSSLNVKGGTLIVSCTNGDAIDSNGNIYISGGTTIANGPSSGVEEAADFNGSFVMSGGFFIGAGSNSNMTKAMSTSSTQPNMYISSSALVSASSFIHIQNASGTDILTFKPKTGGYKFLFSSSTLAKGTSYSIYTGGSYSGGTSSNGLYTGGTYSTSGATLKKTVSLSTSANVNTISF